MFHGCIISKRWCIRSKILYPATTLKLEEPTRRAVSTWSTLYHKNTIPSLRYVFPTSMSFSLPFRLLLLIDMFNPKPWTIFPNNNIGFSAETRRSERRKTSNVLWRETLFQLRNPKNHKTVIECITKQRVTIECERHNLIRTKTKTNEKKKMFECSAPIEMIPSKDQIEQYSEKIDTKKSQGGDLIPLSILKT